MKRKGTFIYLHMSTRALLALAVFVALGGSVLYILIVGGIIEPAHTGEDIRVEAVVAPRRSPVSTEAPAELHSSDSASDLSAPDESTDALIPGSIVVLSEYATLMPGDDNQSVLRLRQRLAELGYMDHDEPSTIYNSSVTSAVSLFQRSSGLEETGIADADLQSSLFSEAAPPYRIQSGDIGNDVSAAQTRLKELGFYAERTTGYFGPQTESAVRLFEYRNGLPDDGILDVTDLKQLFSLHAGTNPEPASDTGTDSFSETNTVTSVYIHSGEGLSHAAADQVDIPYVWGKEGPDAFDSSGFISFCLKLCGISISKTDAEGYAGMEAWQRIDKITLLKKGDLLFFKSDSGPQITHAGISIGTSYFVHASSSNGKVVISSLSEPYWERNFVFARRIFNG